ncbi:hypothetical protein DEW08_05490 [Azospirillum thermophilum]|uniref:Uncharacterized protein n=2 Tax=Azospirillum thermophilum TaxID=2202148 RepID=A0A2S2CMT4_9PROT|nr:hypothetical protein DEW08_05490 [Azospirillum thermophilum]
MRDAVAMTSLGPYPPAPPPGETPMPPPIPDVPGDPSRPPIDEPPDAIPVPPQEPPPLPDRLASGGEIDRRT